MKITVSSLFMNAPGITKRSLAGMTGGTVLERLKHRSTAIGSGVAFILALTLMVATYALLMIAGAAFVAIPAVLGILTMEFKRVRPCAAQGRHCFTPNEIRTMKP